MNYARANKIREGLGLPPLDGSPVLPPVTMQAKSIFGAAGKALLNPAPVSTEERERRLEICNGCEFLVDGKRCSKCGCTVKWKALLEAWHCPVNKW